MQMDRIKNAHDELCKILDLEPFLSENEAQVEAGEENLCALIASKYEVFQSELLTSVLDQ